MLCQTMTNKQWQTCPCPRTMFSYIIKLQKYPNSRPIYHAVVAAGRRTWHKRGSWQREYVVRMEKCLWDGFQENWEPMGMVHRHFDWLPEEELADIYRDVFNPFVKLPACTCFDCMGDGRLYYDKPLEVISFRLGNEEGLARVNRAKRELRECERCRGTGSIPGLPDPILSWHDRLIPQLAQTAYEENDFSNLPIIADALEEANFPHPDLLAHLRSGGLHVRGCWAVELLRKDK